MQQRQRPAKEGVHCADGKVRIFEQAQRAQRRQQFCGQQRPPEPRRRRPCHPSRDQVGNQRFAKDEQRVFRFAAKIKQQRRGQQRAVSQPRGKHGVCEQHRRQKQIEECQAGKQHARTTGGRSFRRALQRPRPFSRANRACHPKEREVARSVPAAGRGRTPAEAPGQRRPSRAFGRRLWRPFQREAGQNTGAPAPRRFSPPSAPLTFRPGPESYRAGPRIRPT